MNWEIEAKTLPYSSSQYEVAQMREEWPTFSPFLPPLFRNELPSQLGLNAGSTRIELRQKQSVKICTMEIDEQPEQYFLLFLFSNFSKNG